MTSYSYSLAADFLNGFDSSKLSQEIESTEGLTASLSHIDTAGDVCTIWFETALSAEEVALLELAISFHTGVQSLPKIYRYVPEVDQSRDHKVIDYKAGLTTRLHRKLITMYRGEVREVHYTNPSDYSDVMLKVTVTYTRAPNGLVLSRIVTRTWVCEDGTDHPDQKITFKDYSPDPVHQMQEGIRRRENVINQLTIQVLGMLMAIRTAGDPSAAEVLGATFMMTLESYTTNFIRTGDNQTIRGVVMTDTTEWLDDDLTALGMPGVTIRYVIYDSLAGIMD